MPKITLTHDEPYSGTDQGAGGQRLDLQPGDVADVSEAKAAQLLEDFPDRFKKGVARRKTPKPEEPYAEVTGDALRELAAQRSVEFDDDADDDTIRAALAGLPPTTPPETPPAKAEGGRTS